MHRELRRCLGDPHADPADRGRQRFTWKGVGCGKKTMMGAGVGMGILVALLTWGLETMYQTHQHPPNSTAPLPSPSPNQTHTRTRRNTPPLVHSTICGSKLILNYTAGTTASYTFDLCSVIDCKGNPSWWRGYDVYLCGNPWLVEGCETRGYPPLNAHEECSEWDYVTKYTGTWVPNGLKTTSPEYRWWSKISLQRDFSATTNPLTLSVNNIAASSNGKTRAWFVLGVDISNKDPMVGIQINIFPKVVPNTAPPTSAPALASPSNIGPIVFSQDYAEMTPLQVLRMSTGYDNDNVWLNWITDNAKRQNMTGCVACASARPAMFTEPAPLYPQTDPHGYACMIGLTRQATPTNCTALAAIFPPIVNETKMGQFSAIRGQANRYMCFNFTAVSPQLDVGIISPDWCNETRNGLDIGPWARAGLFYYCGDLRLVPRIEASRTIGTCAMVRLGMPLTLIGRRLARADDLATSLTKRRRRHIIKREVASGSFSLTGGPTYMDSIGVPRGVPDEYKLADQVAAGFENIPLVAAFFPITPNKNVDRINYVHYNVLRLVNLTRDAVEGLAEQLAPTSLMAMQNRMALDMLLAEKGGVCSMFGDMCCTIIPNNTAPDGSVTKALNSLRTLAEEMHEASGIDNPFSDWMESMFGKWKALIMSIAVSIAVFIAILITCGCCCIPCLRTLIGRLITTALSKEKQPPPYSAYPLLDGDRPASDPEGSWDEEEGAELRSLTNSQLDDDTQV